MIPAAGSARSIVLTGAAGGLGTALADALSRRGDHLLLVDIDEGAVGPLAERLRCDAVVADIATPAGRRRIVERCAEVGLLPDVLVNNAGVERPSRYVDLTAADIERAMTVNLVGTMLLTHDMLPAMLARGNGHVLTMASMAAIKTVPYNTVYNAAKAGLVGFSTSLSKELDGTGVAATVVCPSAVGRVGMWARSRPSLSANRLVDSSTVSPEVVVDAVLDALRRRPRRVLVGSALVRTGALMSALSPMIDAATDRVSRIGHVYSQRTRTDRGNPL